VRRGKKRALIAVGHKILCAAYNILKKHEPYNELGYEYLDSRRKTEKVQHYISKLKKLGIELEVKAMA